MGLEVRPGGLAEKLRLEDNALASVRAEVLGGADGDGGADDHDLRLAPRGDLIDGGRLTGAVGAHGRGDAEEGELAPVHRGTLRLAVHRHIEDRDLVAVVRPELGDGLADDPKTDHTDALLSHVFHSLSSLRPAPIARSCPCGVLR